jgi:hypothetical protein
MIVKCAEADALRGAFPTTLGGMYNDAEMLLSQENGSEHSIAAKTKAGIDNLREKLVPSPVPEPEVIQGEPVIEDVEAQAIQAEAVESAPDQDEAEYRTELLDTVKARLKKFTKDSRLEYLNGRDPEKMDIETLAAFSEELSQLV